MVTSKRFAKFAARVGKEPASVLATPVAPRDIIARLKRRAAYWRRLEKHFQWQLESSPGNPVLHFKRDHATGAVRGVEEAIAIIAGKRRGAHPVRAGCDPSRAKGVMMPVCSEHDHAHCTLDGNVPIDGCTCAGRR